MDLPAIVQTAQTALAVVQDILFVLAAGVFACGIMGKRSGWFAQATPRIWRAVFGIALALAALAYLWLQAAVMSGSSPGGAGPAVIAVLTQSHFGLAWSVSFAGALLAALGGLPKEWGLPLFAVGLVVWVAGKAATSHAADSGDFSWREAIHAAHLLATALWAGSVIVAAILLRVRAPDGGSPGHRAAFCAALSCLATVALAIVFVTGAYNAGQDTAHTGGNLFSTTWGRLLAAKLICVALAVALGGWNRMTALPSLRTRAGRNDLDYPAEQRRFDNALFAEAAVMLAVIVLAALLGHTSPAGG